MDPLVTLIVSRPEMAERLLATHVDDGSGRCRDCALGAQSGHRTWPCSIRIAAEKAAAVLAGRRIR